MATDREEDAAQEEWLHQWNEKRKAKHNEKCKERIRRANMHRNRIWFFGKKKK